MKSKELAKLLGTKCEILIYQVPHTKKTSLVVEKVLSGLLQHLKLFHEAISDR